MKKIMIAAAIVCAAALSQAATAQWNWDTSGMGTSKVWWDNGNTSNLKSTTSAATIYLFAFETISQDELLAGLRNNTYADLSAATSVMSTGLDSESKLVAKSIDAVSGISGSHDYYMAVMDTAGNVFLSKSTTINVQATADTPFTFSGVKDATQASWTSDATFKFDTTKGGKGEGWYAVPEPTSGLLLLLGVAGLALRRRRA